MGDLLNTAAFTFPGADPVKHDTYIIKLDYKLNASGNHSLFMRGNLQNDHEKQPPQFPGQPPFDILTNNSKGIAAGYTALIRNNLINNFRYAFIRQGLGTGGLNTQDYINFRGLDDTQALASQTILTNVPVHNFVDDVSWTRGTTHHSIRHQLAPHPQQPPIRTQTTSPGPRRTFIGWTRHSSPTKESASIPRSGGPAAGGTFPTLTVTLAPPTASRPWMWPGFSARHSPRRTRTSSGTQIPNGQLVPRHFQNFEGEMYLQDKWSVTPKLVVTYGVRYSLLQPPFENTGNQVAPTVNMEQWFKTRGTTGGIRVMRTNPI